MPNAYVPLIKSTSLRTLSICVTPCRVIDLLDRASRNVAGIIDKDIDAGGFVRAWELKVFGYINLTRLVHADMKSRNKGDGGSSRQVIL
jgi:hypothetical protein